jgi:hypothetical protein
MVLPVWRSALEVDVQPAQHTAWHSLAETPAAEYRLRRPRRADDWQHALGQNQVLTTAASTPSAVCVPRARLYGLQKRMSARTSRT